MYAFYYKYGRYDIDGNKEAMQAESNVMYVCRAVSSNLYALKTYTDYKFEPNPALPRKFLSNYANVYSNILPYQQPKKRITREQQDFLYFIVEASDCEPTTEDTYIIVFSYYLTTGVKVNNFKEVNFKSGIHYININIEKLITAFGLAVDPATITSYEVDIENAELQEVSEIRLFKLLDEDCEETVTLLFENRLGGLETFVFRGEIQRPFEASFEEYEQSFDYNHTSKDGTTKVRKVEAFDRLKMSAGMLTKQEKNNIEELFLSPNIYILGENFTYDAVKIKNISFSPSSRAYLYDCDIELTFCYPKTSLSN